MKGYGAGALMSTVPPLAAEMRLPVKLVATPASAVLTLMFQE